MYLNHFLAAVLCGAFSVNASAATLRSEVTLNGPWVTVGDLVDPAPDSAVASLKVKRLIQPGKTFEITRDQVALKIREARLGGAEIPLMGAVSKVHASSKVIPAADIQAFGTKYLKDRLNALSGVAEVDVKLASTIRDALVPDRPVKFQITPRAGQNWRGNVVLRVALLQTIEDGSELEVGQAVLPFTVKVTQNLVLASKLIRRGELIGPENTKLSPVDASYLQFEGYTTLEQVQGFKARLPILAEKPIDPMSLERPAAVKRGDIIKLLVRSGLVSVEVSAKAMRDAAIGDSIPVEVQDSKKQIQARVLDERTAVSDTR